MSEKESSSSPDVRGHIFLITKRFAWLAVILSFLVIGVIHNAFLYIRGLY